MVNDAQLIRLTDEQSNLFVFFEQRHWSVNTAWDGLQLEWKSASKVRWQ